MKNVIVKALLAGGVMALSAGAYAVPVYLVQEGLRSASSGGVTNMIFTGSAGTSCTHNTSPVGGPAAPPTACTLAPSTATYDWDASTGILTQTGGTQISARWSGSNPASGSLLYADYVTGLVLQTTPATTPGGSTSAASYSCFEGNFGEGTGASSCGNYAYGANTFDETTRSYNVGGNANCVLVGTANGAGGLSQGDDAQPGVLNPGGTRGLAQPGADPFASCSFTVGARDMVHFYSNALSSTFTFGGSLTLWNVINNDTTSTPAGCVAPVGQPPLAGCGGAHWMTFITPVPAAVWLFGSALGLLGWVRRRALA